MSGIKEKQDKLVENLELFPDWAVRYEYVISLGKTLDPMPDSSRNDEHLIKGCQAKVWLDAEERNGLVFFMADSDSLITKGMIAIFISVLNGETPDAILTADMDFVEKTGLREHLLSTRANALTLMATQMKQRALAFAK